jgi:DNA-binding response OmpR family regulator
MKVVLVVEDDEQLSEALARMLERGGYFAIQADDGEAAVASLKLVQISLLVVDIKLPGIDGYAVIEKCKAFRPGVPILAISGLEEEALAKALRVGANAALAKPFHEAELLRAVQKLISAGAPLRAESSGG